MALVGHTADIEKGHHALERGAVKVLAIEGREGIEPEPERLAAGAELPKRTNRLQLHGDLRIHVTAIHQTFQLEIAEWLLVMKTAASDSVKLFIYHFP